ncbi:MAG: polysaccharide pyruvyl transferase family protein [Oscillospiraceae bacterium]
MNVGLLTFHDAINYGAVLQAQALCDELNIISGGHCEIIDYKCASIDNMYRTNTGNILFSKIKTAYQLLKRDLFRKYLKKVSEFSQSVNRESIDRLADKYDVIIVGSDQVWNAEIIGHDSAYVLSVGNKSIIKASYAASFGNYILVEKDKKFYKSLESFSGLSVREPNGVDRVYDLIGKKATVHIDPTLLKSTDYWEKFASNKRKKEKYIFLYVSGNAEAVIKAALEIKKKTDYKIYYMGNCHIKEGKKLSFVLPDEWLGLIKNAEVVLTNSFHGTAFSIIFRKKFFVDLGIAKDGVGIINDRAGNLLNIMGLEKQVIKNAPEKYDEEIDWSVLERELPKYQNESRSYLESVVGERSKVCG